MATIDHLDQINQRYAASYRYGVSDDVERWSALCDRATSSIVVHGDAVARLLIRWADAYGVVC